ncbi:MBL fold metallo-hydrolase [Pseudaestuariivita rosea]|uniref:MBL fold metallo-hydrolase n=1 Tax=Pseudaestuariivita rosea TaxID=2763263 RepID=UPI001ABAB6A6|nr:MBL fold metallo-hydrolase [Pseudaestuariivita rosea]
MTKDNVITALQDGLRAIRAPNPSPMTYTGTMTYLLGHKDIVVIDPGPVQLDHLHAILNAVPNGNRISHILVTHSHIDHSSLAAHLAAKTSAPILAFGDAEAGRSPVMQKLAQSGQIDGGEGIDTGFQPTQTLKDGQVIGTPAGAITAIWTPGHLGNHMCFQWENAIFTGDHVMGWATSLISPPDGDLTQFMASCDKLLRIAADVYYPGHGDPITAPHVRLGDLIQHRKARETQILNELQKGDATASELTAAIYKDTPAVLRPAAYRNVLAHLVDLEQKNIICTDGLLSINGRFRLLDHIDQ